MELSSLRRKIKHLLLKADAKKSKKSIKHSKRYGFQTNNGIKLLVLGTDECAKDTLVNMMRFIRYRFTLGLQEPEISTSAPYELGNLEKREKTTGITVVDFLLDNRVNFKIMDFSRHNEPKCSESFQDMTAIIFCVPLSEYDEVLSGDNQMQESLKLFDLVCNSQWFKDTPIILFLTKRDLFEKQIKKSPLTICFPEYTGSQEYREAAGYIFGKFESKNRSNRREIYCCTTNTTYTVVQFMSDAIDDIILTNNLISCGLY